MSSLAVRLKRSPDAYAFCAEDSFWFRPAYTEGKCPLCGEEASGGSPPLSLLLRMDRFMLGLAVLGLASVAMTVLVLVMFFT